MLEGKKVLILGVANQKSIAWAVAKSLKNRGAQIALTYANEAIEKRLRPLAEEIECEDVFRCDVTSDSDIDNLFSSLSYKWGSLDGIVHSIAYAEAEDLKGRFVETSREGFKTALDISAYSLVALARRGRDLMKEGGSIVTMTYLGSVRVVPSYKVMGVAKAALEASVRYLADDLGTENIRVNAVSPGPIKTLAASGIPKFREMLKEFAEMAPLKRNVSQDDVAKVVCFYLSDESSGITGEVTYVDCGFNLLGISKSSSE
ncbi:MAG: enoyl-ACP reductase [Candidatus Dadabacteria bacterium]|nr:MAG: enoyl-ACP reductase [Candidatus Dadabacteria bacterium]